MPTITFTLSAGDLTRAVTAISTRYGYSSTLDDGVTPNPQTQTEFARQRVARWIRDEVKEHELNTARAAVTVSEVTVG